MWWLQVLDQDVESDVSLASLMEMGIMNHLEELEGISSNAMKEFALRNRLLAMKVEWKPISFKTISYQCHIMSFGFIFLFQCINSNKNLL